METVEKSNPDFSPVSTALGNPATDAGFPHFHSHDGGGYPLPLKANPAKIAGPVRFLRRALFSSRVPGGREAPYVGRFSRRPEACHDDSHLAESDQHGRRA